MKTLLALLLLAGQAHADEIRVTVYDRDPADPQARVVEESSGESYNFAALRAWTWERKKVDIGPLEAFHVERNLTQERAAKKLQRKADAKGPKREKILDLMIEDYLKQKNIDVGGL